MATLICVDGSSPFVVSLSRIMKEPRRFPGAVSCRSASFLLMPLKNHLKKKRTWNVSSDVSQQCELNNTLNTDVTDNISGKTQKVGRRTVPHSSVSRVSLAT